MGTLNAINLHTGKYAWKIPLGKFPHYRTQHHRHRFGELWRPVVTAGGLLFIGATNFDRQFRAFDKYTGKLLWKSCYRQEVTPLPLSTRSKADNTL